MLSACCGSLSPLVLLYSLHASSRIAPSGVPNFPTPQWLALSISGSGLEDCSAPKAALQVAGQGCRACRAGRWDHRSGEPADVEPGYRDWKRWSVPEPDGRIIRQTELSRQLRRQRPWAPKPQDLFLAHSVENNLKLLAASRSRRAPESTRSYTSLCRWKMGSRALPPASSACSSCGSIGL
jgi:hypothetical protein